MLKTHQLTVALGVLALAFGSQACTVVEKNPDDETDTDETEATDESDGDDETEAGDSGADMSDTDAGDEETDSEGTDDEATDTGTDDDGGAPSDETDDGGAPSDETDDEPEPEPEGEEYGAALPDWECGDRSDADMEITTSTINDDTTWSGTIQIDGEVRLRGDLTIEPGTKLLMGPEARIIVGYLSSASALHVNGSPDAPVIVCGEQPDAGFWRGFRVESNVVGSSKISNLLIDGAGSGEPSLSLGADVLLDTVVVRNGGGAGVRAADFNDDSSGLFVTGNEGNAVELTADVAVANFPRGGNLTGNDDDVVLLDFNRVENDTTFRDLAIPYSFNAPELRFTNDATVVIEAGVELVMGADSRLEIGYLSSAVTIRVDGTEDNPVVLRGDADDAGFWRGVAIKQNVRSNSFIRHLELRDAGGDSEPALQVESAVAISDLAVSNSGRGVRIRSQGLAKDCSRWSITGTESEPLEIETDAWPTLPSDSTFVGNTDDRVVVESGRLSTDGLIRRLDVPYLVKGEIRLADEVETTIEAGTEFLMTADSRWIVGYLSSAVSLIAEGTEDAPIRFVGLDSVPGYWDGIDIQRNVSSVSRLSFVEIGHAGQSSAALILRTPVNVENCTLFDSDSAGIAKDSDDTTDYASSNTFIDNAGDDVIEL